MKTAKVTARDSAPACRAIGAAIAGFDPRTLPARIHHLRASGVSGAHALHAFQEGTPETLARRLGSGTHAMLLSRPWATWDQPSKASVERRDKALAAGKPPTALTPAPRSGVDWAAFQEKHAGAAIMSVKETDAAKRMVDAIRAHGPACRLLDAPNVIMERSIVWSQLGRARQSTPDLRRAGDAWGPSFNCEIKTTRCAHPIPFGRDAQRMTYHAQLADQAAAIAYETGKPPSHSFIIAVESSPPHVVQVYEVPRNILEEGASLCAHWLERLQLFEMNGSWHGYSQRIEALEFPVRAMSADPSWAVGDESNETEKEDSE